MAIMHQGFMGGFTGKLGDKVGYRYRGKMVLRSLPKKRKGPPSQAQIEHREKFTIVTKFLKPLSSFMMEVHKKTIKNMSGYSKLSSLNMNTIITGNYPDLKIEYSKVLLTKGSLRGLDHPIISCARNGHIVFRWNDDGGVANGLASDQVHLLFYIEESKDWKILKNIADRRDGGCILDMKEFRCCRLQTYVSIISCDGHRVSNSQYTGMIHVL